MAGFSSASMFIKIALGLGAGAVLFDIIGFPTPYWTSIDIAGTTLSNGLFEYCSGETCKSITEAMKTDEIKAATAMALLGFLVGLGCLVLTILHVFVQALETKLVKTVCIILAFVAAVLTLIGVIIYGTKYDTNLGWSFILVIIGGLLYIATGGMLVVDRVKG